MMSAYLLRNAGITARLVHRARQLAEAHGESRLRAQRGDSWRWRSARLLWPLFGKEKE